MEEKKMNLSEALIGLYLNVKIRSEEDIEQYNEDQLEEEREKLRRIDSLTLIEYIQTSIEILLNLKEEQDGQRRNINESVTSERSTREPPKDYEEIIQKLEAEVRTHIRIEQQLKLHIDSLEEKMEEDERYNSKGKTECKRLEQENKELKEQLARKTSEIEQMKRLLEERKKHNGRLEEKLKLQVQKVSDLERGKRKSTGASVTYNHTNSGALHPSQVVDSPIQDRSKHPSASTRRVGDSEKSKHGKYFV